MRVVEHVLPGSIRHVVPGMRVVQNKVHECAEARRSISFLEGRFHRLHHALLNINERCPSELTLVSRQTGEQRDGWRLG